MCRHCPCLSTSLHWCPYILDVRMGTTSMFVDLLTPMLLHPRWCGGRDHRARLPTPMLLHPWCWDGRDYWAHRLPRWPMLSRPSPSWLSSRSLHSLMSEHLPQSWHWWLGLHRLFPADHQMAHRWLGSSAGSPLARVCNYCNQQMLGFVTIVIDEC
jgi:hypothetical protein